VFPGIGIVPIRLVAGKLSITANLRGPEAASREGLTGRRGNAFAALHFHGGPACRSPLPTPCSFELGLADRLLAENVFPDSAQVKAMKGLVG
jgi:hypothetical protein